MASDRGTPPRKKDHILQVTILDVNDNPPVIESPFGYNVSVNEVKIPTVDHGQKLTMRHPFKRLPDPLVPQSSEQRLCINAALVLSPVIYFCDKAETLE